MLAVIYGRLMGKRPGGGALPNRGSYYLLSVHVLQWGLPGEAPTAHSALPLLFVGGKLLASPMTPAYVRQCNCSRAPFGMK
jgi:hypothetical protein